jgi:hypothetical protein
VRPPHQWLIVAPACSGSPVHTDPLATHAWNALLLGCKRWVMFHPSTPARLLNPWHRRHKHLPPRCLPRGGGGEGSAEEGEQEEERDDEWEDLYGWFHDDLPGIRRAVAQHFGSAQQQPATATPNSPNSPLPPNPVAGAGGGDGAAEWWYHEFTQRAGETVFVPTMWHHAVLNLTDTVAVTHNYVSRVNLAASYRSATGGGGGGSSSPSEAEAAAEEGAGGRSGEMETALCAAWRELMVRCSPELATQHMPADFLLPPSSVHRVPA